MVRVYDEKNVRTTPTRKNWRRWSFRDLRLQNRKAANRASRDDSLTTNSLTTTSLTTDDVAPDINDTDLGNDVFYSHNDREFNNNKYRYDKTDGRIDVGGKYVPTDITTILSTEGHIPKGAVYVGEDDKIEGNVRHTDKYYLVPSGEKTKTTRRIEQKAPKYQGIGPTDDGLPVGLRSKKSRRGKKKQEEFTPKKGKKHIDDKNQKDWYKQMYKTLHQQHKKDSSNPYTPTYTFPESSDDESRKDDENPYTPSYMFPSPHYRDKDETRSLDQYATYPRSKSLSDTRSHDAASDTEYTSRKSTGAWTPPHARSKIEVYKNQPRSIQDYEPGFSSIAFKEAKSSGLHNPPIDKPGQFSRYTEGPDSDLHSVGSGSQLSPQESREAYLTVLHGGDVPVSGFRKQIPERPREPVAYSPPARPEKPRAGGVPRRPAPRSPLSAVEQLRVTSPPPQRDEGPRRYSDHAVQQRSPRSPVSTLDRKKMAEEDTRRRERMHQMYEEEKRRKAMEEKQRNDARRHSDNLLPEQKSPIAPNRFEEGDRLPDSTKIRKKKIGTEIRGKAKATHTFNAQNPKELSFKRGDTLYLTRDIDANWFEGEHHGTIGIFPKNYAEVVTSLEDARAAMAEAEGQGRVKYNFNAQTNVEISMKKGDTVALLRRLDENWFEGRCRGATGIFPVSYIDVQREPSTPLVTPMTSRMTTPATSGFTTPANFDSPPGPLSPIHLNGPTDGIDAISPTPMDNYKYHPQPLHAQEPYRYNSTSERRSYGGPTQTSPSSHRTTPVAQKTSPKQPVSPVKKQPELNSYRALYNYKPHNEDELEIKEGDEIYVMERCDDGWYVGTSARTGNFGTFPGNYVQPV